MKKSFWILLAGLSGCASVEKPNVEFCHVAGVMEAGASCGWTIAPPADPCADGQLPEIRRITTRELIEFLEPAPAKTITICPGTAKEQKIEIPARGAALITSSESLEKIKTALEQMCRLLGSRCTSEAVEQTKAVFSKLEKNSKVGVKNVEDFSNPVPMPVKRK